MKKIFLIFIYIFSFFNISIAETIYSSEDIYKINGAQVFVLDEK